MCKYYLLTAIIAIFSLNNYVNAQQDLKDPYYYEAVKGTQFKIVQFVRQPLEETATSQVSGGATPIRRAPQRGEIISRQQFQMGTRVGLTEVLSDEFKLAQKKFLFQKVTVKKHPDPTKDYKIVEIAFPNYTLDPDSSYVDMYINSNDNGQLFWMREDDFNDLVNQKFIFKKYRFLYPTFSYGASLSLPFKMRPTTNDQNMKITPEFTLGGYGGLKLRLSKYNDFFITIPVVTLGVTSIGINDNNTIKEIQSPSTEKNKDALILGRTISTGFVLQYEQFQMGFIAGWDRASGEIGKNWIYNDRAWYSFSIGFSFLGGTTGKQ